MKAFIYWSGGKDAAMALQAINKQGIIPRLLVCRVDENNKVAAHETPLTLIQAQARATGMPLLTVTIPAFSPNAVFENIMGKHLEQLKTEGYTHAVFGDLFLEELKEYHQNLHRRFGIECIFPLWKKDTLQLAHEVLSEGIKAIVTAVNTKFLNENFAGRPYDKSFINDLPADIDPCGENGEFHTFVHDAPYYSTPVKINNVGVIKTVTYNTGTAYETTMACIEFTLDE